MKDPEINKSCCLPTRDASVDVCKVEVGNCLPVKNNTPRLLSNSVATGGDWFAMGSAEYPHPQDGEAPVRQVWIDAFALSSTAVTNSQFRDFIDDTGYQTQAERIGSSFVFHLFVDPLVETAVSNVAPWWCDVAGASWKSPEGVDSSLDGRWDHPVVHVTRDDVLAYCRWGNWRLPTEAEWEFAARGGLTGKLYPWGDELTPDGQYRCNIWQGEFPTRNSCDDGFAGTAPVRQYPANGYGFYNMTGNVWEWVADRFTHMHSPRKVKNPRGPLNGDHFVAKGGSYLCHESYCLRYRTSSRQSLLPDVSAGNLGFRVAVDSDASG